MTSNDALDRRLTAWLEDEAVPHAPGALEARFIAGLDGARQRPGWATTERWISMETRAQLGVVPRSAIILVTVAILALLAGAIVVASAERTPPPFGIAGNGLIAYSDGGDLYVVEPDGTGRRALTTGPELDDAPTWSRDGTRLSYWSEPADGGPPFELRVVDVSGGVPTTIAQPDGDYTGWFMTWSADSSEVAFSAGVPGVASDSCSYIGDEAAMCGSRIFLAAADGSGSRQIGDPDLDARNPELSPDGWTLAFGGGPGANQALYRMGWDGSDVRRLTSADVPGGSWAFVHSAWSPDGTRIVTQSGSDEIWEVEADGSGERNISNSPADENIARYAPGDETISWWRNAAGVVLLGPDATDPVSLPRYLERGLWSPDGELLVANDIIGSKLVVVDRQGTILAEIETAGLGFYPSWQRIAQ